MNEETARTVVMPITAVGAVAWLAGLTLMLRTNRERQARANEAAEYLGAENSPDAGTIVGEADVDGQPDTLSGMP